MNMKSITTNETGLRFLMDRKDIEIACIKFDPGKFAWTVEFVDVEPKPTSRYVKFNIRKK